jgi:uncharacterized protein (UPF0332 family)
MFTWSEFLRLASDTKGSRDEAALRTAISRAYYAAYHIVRHTVENRHGKRFRGPSVHEQLWEFLRSEPGLESDARIAGNRGLALRQLRTDADYEVNPKRVWERELDGACESAKQIILLMTKSRF